MCTEVVGGGRWGTWEELLLGGAVLRYGTRDWNLVSSELRARTLCPFSFTPQVCKSKYEDLQQRYSGSKVLFEELRKQRMEELKRALEKSDDSIGSLETKLEVLKSKRTKTNYGNLGCDLSPTESVLPFQKSDGALETSSKETSKDGLSAGSFTQENRTNWSPECQVPESASVEDIETKPDILLIPKQEKVSSIGYLAETFSIRRRRGKRKRKDCRKEVKEGSVGDSECWGSADVLSATLCKENSATSSGQTGKCSGVDDKSGGSNKELPDLKSMFDSIAENKCATVFRRRLDSQKRGRYKKMILQHVDFDTLRSRIASNSITSVKEMFRDLLLLANNALVFYSKTTREYKSAFLLREIVTKSLRQNLKNYITKTTTTTTTTTTTNTTNTTLVSAQQTMPQSSAKPRSIRPGNQKVLVKVSKPVNTVAQVTPNAAKKSSKVRSPASAESLTLTKKAAGRPRKTGQRLEKRPENTVKGRKRSRAK
ncbi:bromodomain 4 [Euphorbia peplus]|nr:bromodomain 4 [Euphorbia peplus]